jgi:hypothetical protein
MSEVIIVTAQFRLDDKRVTDVVNSYVDMLIDNSFKVIVFHCVKKDKHLKGLLKTFFPSLSSLINGMLPYSVYNGKVSQSNLLYKQIHYYTNKSTALIDDGLRALDVDFSSARIIVHWLEPGLYIDGQILSQYYSSTLVIHELDLELILKRTNSSILELRKYDRILCRNSNQVAQLFALGINSKVLRSGL